MRLVSYTALRSIVHARRRLSNIRPENIWMYGPNRYRANRGDPLVTFWKDKRWHVKPSSKRTTTH